MGQKLDMSHDASRRYRPAATTSFYDVLQVSPTASQEVVHAAYRALARSCHPDVNPSEAAAKRMLELNTAYTVLSDTRRRAEYDLRCKRLTRTVAAPFPKAPAPNVIRGKPARSSPRRIEDERAARAARMPMRSRLLTLVLMLVVLGIAVGAALWITSSLLDEVADGAVPTALLLATAQPFLNHA
jgi:DnaJ-like protein